MRFITIAVSIAFFCGVFLAYGCGPSESPTPAASKLPEGNPHKGFCPVMGEPIDYAKADKDPALHEDYQGKRYYFCCAACDEKFKEDPEKYIKEPVQPKEPEGSGTKE